ncbi:MAG: T9SS type A sorting domain-containing protein [Ignavibacteriaceae bacterium]|nr:T9SS type A sorting domain-containing protein [Ignavibacteriaceae bacterium]
MPLIKIIPQNPFITARESKFIKNGSQFSFLGINAYYLQHEAASPDRRYIIDEVFAFAQNIGIKVIRTWAFNNSEIINPSVISSKPDEYREEGLISLDYVVAKAKEYDLLVILCLANNEPDYGGINQYVAWANKYLASANQKFEHNHFFTNESIITWYYLHLYTLLNRKNTFTGVAYKDDPAIFSFELINEASNPGFSFDNIYLWYDKVSNYFRSIDSNHMLATGEIGYDIDNVEYSDIKSFYNNANFLFNGSKGTSFKVNSMLPQISYTSIHSYPESWNMNYKSGITWIRDHSNISENLSKPMLLGEFGVKNNKVEVYKEWLQEIKKTKCQSAIVWHYVHKDILNMDGYGFNEFNSPGLIEMLTDFIKDLNKSISKISALNPEQAELNQNYPNPVIERTTITYSLPKDDFVSIVLYNSFGELVQEIDKGYKQKGNHEITISLNAELLPSGIYIYTLKTSDKILSKKMVFLK